MTMTTRSLLLAAIALAGTSAHAQQTVDPGRVDERLRGQPAMPSVSPAELPQAPTSEAAPESTAPLRLSLIRFEGATAVPLDVLNALAQPYLNRDITLADLFRLAEAVTTEYRRRGFVLSRAVVAPQRIENGVATINIVEGFIGDVRVEGDPGGYRPLLEGYFAPVRAERPTSGDDLARALLLARDLKGASVRAVLTPSSDEGAADLSLLVARQPIEAFVAVDNRGSRWLGPVQLFGGLVFNDLAQLGGRLALTAVAAPDESGELAFVSGAYDQPLGGSGLRMSGFASFARTKPGDELRVLAVKGKSFSWGLALQYPLVRSRQTNVLGRFSWQSRESSSRNRLIDPVFDDRIRTVTAELLGNHADRLGGQTTLRASVTQGLDVFDATRLGDPAKSRGTASAMFTRLNGEVTRVQPLYRGLHLLLGATGQWSAESLLASEEFGLGGAQYGRAYDPSEITGDKGIAGKVELFYTIAARGMGTVEPYVYYEGGRVWQNDLLPGERPRAGLRSYGAGLRAGIADRFSLSMEYAKPVRRAVSAEGNRDGRIFVSLSAAY
ncbi:MULTISPECIES: ShlB/FhaC/HecB family hemolysin secretion/activation protein [unclassified Sphingobium]|uniref:ShlB/FhaC/HecB family hemolysin secretion/activation protein n=1 Tax=unclassified Sphingobium TaxID=2611147 RepID=UPI002224149C|nr:MULTISPECIES: ShlB/FhaC/HecB family hemolysin secretion/activation protein [unclassified Sphingobium]MCW2383207.1 hemolysin activation/secretion protein [Sphingobium sp. B2D3B]MCW2399818.1 hemolysin activation/secretion protein [Sphingobium sp. B2D3C]